MEHSAEHVVKGLMNYADAEVMLKLPTSGKWIVGTVLNLAEKKIEYVIESLLDNPIIQMLGIMDEDGNIDTDALMDAMKHSADKYGKVTLEVPLVGTMTFSANDIEKLKAYIM